MFQKVTDQTPAANPPLAGAFALDRYHNQVMIYHWCDRSDWERAGEAYTAPSLVDEGFIHFSYRRQVARTAFATDPGHQNLVLLCVDESDLDVVDEDCYELGEKYPHVYSPIPVASVVAVLPFPSEPDGTFLLPDGMLD